MDRTLSTPGSHALAHTQAQASQNPYFAYLASLSSEKSRRTMSSILNQIATTLGAADATSCPWPQLRRNHLNALLLSAQQEGKSPSTLKLYLSAAKGVCREAWLLKQLGTDEYTQIRDLKAPKGSRLAKGRRLDDDELVGLIRHCQNQKSAKGARDAAIITVLGGCGLRRSEIVSINYEDVDLTDGSFRVIGKGNKERVVYMPPLTLGLTQRWITDYRGEEFGPLFTRVRKNCDVTDAALTDQAIYHILKERQMECGLESFGPHDLRRTFASKLLDHGEDLLTVKEAMGHSDITTTQRYDHRGEQRLAKAAKAFKFQ